MALGAQAGVVLDAFASGLVEIAVEILRGVLEREAVLAPEAQGMSQHGVHHTPGTSGR